MDQISADLRETNLHDSLVRDHEFWKKAIKVADPEQENGKEEESINNYYWLLVPQEAAMSVESIWKTVLNMFIQYYPKIYTL